MTVRRWRGATYDRLSAPMEQLGLEVLARLDLKGDETVLDAGCGSGRVTAALVERLPRGRVIGIDSSASMIDAARERLGDSVDLRVADLLELELDRPVDAILSTATFHWIADHRALFRSLRGALRDGGCLAAQCGGAGNITSVVSAAEEVLAAEPYAPHVATWHRPWRFATAEETDSILRAAGFATATCWLEPRPVVPDEPRAFLREINCGAHLEQLPAELHEPFLDALLERLGARPTIDYVRLNIDATA